MTIALSSPVTGSTMGVFTAPTYTVVLDTSAANPRSKQWAVTALGGTQTGVRVSTVGDPFTWAYLPPAVLRGPPVANPITGKYGAIGANVHTLTTLKGVNYAANQAPYTCRMETKIFIGQGCEAYDSANIRAMANLHDAGIHQVISGLGDTVVSGIP